MFDAELDVLTGQGVVHKPHSYFPNFHNNFPNYIVLRSMRVQIDLYRESVVAYDYLCNHYFGLADDLLLDGDHNMKEI